MPPLPPPPRRHLPARQIAEELDFSERRPGWIAPDTLSSAKLGGPRRAVVEPVADAAATANHESPRRKARRPMAKLQEPDFQSVAEVAGDLRVSQKHVRRLMKSGRLPYYRIGHVIRIRRRDKGEFIHSCHAQN